MFWTKLQKNLQVTPFMGVWIEIVIGVIKLVGSAVTPFMGVWIEIFLRNDNVEYNPVTPFMGVWI